MSAQVVQFPRRQVAEVPLTLKQLTSEVGLSKRCLEYRIVEGMPVHGVDYKGRRIFLASECRRWLDERQKRMGRI
jgi:hypothetical protein